MVGGCPSVQRKQLAMWSVHLPPFVAGNKAHTSRMSLLLNALPTQFKDYHCTVVIKINRHKKCFRTLSRIRMEPITCITKQLCPRKSPKQEIGTHVQCWQLVPCESWWNVEIWTNFVFLSISWWINNNYQSGPLGLWTIVSSLQIVTSF